jgi:hypothetical protein
VALTLIGSATGDPPIWLIPSLLALLASVAGGMTVLPRRINRTRRTALAAFAAETGLTGQAGDGAVA